MDKLHRNISEAFNLRSGEIVTLVGAGGKTTFMFTLAQELASQGKKVITTTTTKIWVPANGETERFIVDVEGNLPSNVFERHHHATCVTRVFRENLRDKAEGVNPQKIGEWLSALKPHCIIVEADGARGKPFKAPASYEPVIPPDTTLYIPMVSVEVLGKKLTAEAAHRPEIVAKLTGINHGDKITASTVAKVLKHYLQMTPSQARSIVFVNKLLSEEDVKKVMPLAEHLKGEKIVFGDVHSKKFWKIT
ncbi:selenium cofactor biosynthesis protein YqeC [Candidatus Hecatella orcuttiae]|uniref:selenium cofactor biosynthesis protein YqeC n=1 Tax=Candidatus Hecatella orcuttiae TaxID=1935119 RepID=UPI0028681A25|nr:selenium cofactor biosynthesis protein YqeC [Candidatus Hecatella orcuttiae]